MSQEKHISQQGLEMLKQFEGCRLNAYADGGGYSIGYGHYGANAGDSITQAEADRLLASDLAWAEGTVNKLGVSLNQKQFDALVSLVYNIGTGNFASSTVRKLILQNTTPRTELKTAWMLWTKSRVNGQLTELKSLKQRREQEYTMYSSLSATTSIDGKYLVLAGLVLAGLAIFS